MSTDSADLRLAELLAQRAWVRTLARALVRDEATADDLEQETWLAALENPPTWSTSPRGWLAGVLRRRAARVGRTAARVARRERAAARPEAEAPADDVVAQAEQHRRVVDAVLALDEAPRTAVLLRCYEGLPPREIARRTGAPVETVRARVRRGLAEVRERLDREHGGERRAWKQALAPLLGGPFLVPVSGPGVVATSAGAAARAGTGAAKTAASAAGVLGMTSTTTKVTVGALALLALGWAGWALWPAEARRGDERRADERAAAGAPGESGPTLAAGPARPPEKPAAGSPATAVPARTGIRIVAKDDGRPLPGARLVALGDDSNRRVTAEAVADAEGYAVLPRDTGRVQVVWATAPGFAPARRTDVQPTSAATVIALERASPIRLRFVDAGGATLSADHVATRFQAGGGAPGAEWIWPEAFSPAGLGEFLASRIDGGATWRLATALAVGGEGAVPADGLPAEGARLLVHTPGGVPWLSDPLAVGGAQDLVVPVDPAVVLTLRLLADEDATPLAGATVRAFTEYGDDALFLAGPARAANAEGRATIGLPPVVPRKRGPSLLVEAPGRALWIHHTTLSEWARRAAEQVHDVRVPRTATIEGHAWTPAGEPAVGWEVVFWQRGLVRRTRVGADGTFRLEGVAPWELPESRSRQAKLMLRDDQAGGPHGSATVDVVPGQTASADLGSPKTVARTGFRGRVRAGDRPVPGQFVGIMSDAGSMPDGKFVVTDTEGRYELHEIPPGNWRLVVLLGNPHVSDDFVLRSRVATVVRAGEMTTLDLVLPEGSLRVQVLDAATGKPIPGAMTAARLERADTGKDAVVGFEGRLGSSAILNAEGRARLEGFPLGEPLEVAGFADGYAEGTVKGALAGTGDGVSEVVVRLAKK